MQSYYNSISNDFKKGDLHCSDPAKCLQNGAKSSESQEHRVEPIKIPCYLQGSVVRYWFWHRPRDYSQWKYHEEIDGDDCEVEKIPMISVREQRSVGIWIQIYDADSEEGRAAVCLSKVLRQLVNCTLNRRIMPTLKEFQTKVHYRNLTSVKAFPHGMLPRFTCCTMKSTAVASERFCPSSLI